tara:strand:- start:401 stop:574 length:174 start_codon:yes stop_codon:yes gene_type:complete
MKKYITVLDFELGKVFQYEIYEEFFKEDDYEKYLMEKGHKLSNCEWMIHNYNKIITE